MALVGPAAGHPEIGSRKNAKAISARAELDAVMARIARLNACIEAEVGSVQLADRVLALRPGWA